MIVLLIVIRIVDLMRLALVIVMQFKDALRVRVLLVSSVARYKKPRFLMGVDSHPSIIMPFSNHAPIVRILSANGQWAEDVKKAEPEFFQQTTKGQSPHVSMMESDLILDPPGPLNLKTDFTFWVHRFSG